MVQLSHSDMTTGKNIVLTRQTFVGKVMSLLFKMLVGHSFFSRNQSLNVMAAVTICSDFGSPKIKSLFPLFPHLFAIK